MVNTGTNLTTNAEAQKAIHLVCSLGSKRERLSQTFTFDMSPREAGGRVPRPDSTAPLPVLP